MTEPRLTIESMTPAIGAEVSGVDFGRPLTSATADAIYQALIDHLVIFFHDQSLTPEAHLAFARSFGELDTPHHIYPHVVGFEQIVRLENHPDRPPDTHVWHTDLTFKKKPPFASILWAKEVPPVGGDTLWVSMYAAYEALPAAMKTMLDGLSAVHDMGSFRNDYLAGGVTALNEAMRTVGSAVHPIVPRHPVTGRPFLYVNKGFTVQIAGQSTPDSDRLLAYLFDHIDQPEFQIRFRWRAGTVAMWDNRVTQHYAVADYQQQARCMHRVTVVNDRRAATAAATDVA